MKVVLSGKMHFGYQSGLSALIGLSLGGGRFDHSHFMVILLYFRHPSLSVL